MFNSLTNAILDGILLGFTLAILTGPAFFALLQTSIRNGYKSGIAFAIGVFISDTIIISLSYLGALRLFNDPKNNFIIGIIGGTILIMFGIFNTFQKHPLEMETREGDMEKLLSKKTTLPMIALKGFAINLINPFVIIFWLGVVGTVSTHSDFSQFDIITLFATTLLTVLGTDILKAIGANKITSFLSPNILHWINRIAGIILVISGIIMIGRVVKAFL
ncbi:MAG: LysE family transporter [Bacteroidetes bacterium]|nr:LysE family transporter [Bacteroidota bacterium]